MSWKSVQHQKIHSSFRVLELSGFWELEPGVAHKSSNVSSSRPVFGDGTFKFRFLAHLVTYLFQSHIVPLDWSSTIFDQQLGLQSSSASVMASALIILCLCSSSWGWDIQVFVRVRIQALTHNSHREELESLILRTCIWGWDIQLPRFQFSVPQELEWMSHPQSLCVPLGWGAVSCSHPASLCPSCLLPLSTPHCGIESIR